jgi:hypothetical protein
MSFRLQSGRKNQGAVRLALKKARRQRLKRDHSFPAAKPGQGMGPVKFAEFWKLNRDQGESWSVLRESGPGYQKPSGTSPAVHDTVAHP